MDMEMNLKIEREIPRVLWRHTHRPVGADDAGYLRPLAD